MTDVGENFGIEILLRSQPGQVCSISQRYIRSLCCLKASSICQRLWEGSAKSATEKVLLAISEVIKAWGMRPLGMITRSELTSESVGWLLKVASSHNQERGDPVYLACVYDQANSAACLHYRFSTLSKIVIFTLDKFKANAMASLTKHWFASCSKDGISEAPAATRSKPCQRWNSQLLRT